MPERSETSYIIHDIVPLFEQFEYPGAGDHECVRVNDVPVYRPSGGRSGSTMDIVYYHNREPVLLVEAKRRHRTHAEALDEAKNYLRNFPKDDENFAPSGKAPFYIATTVGREIKFYKHWFNIEDGQLIQCTKEVERMSFGELIAEYGLQPEFTPQRLSATDFREKFLNELLTVFVLDIDEGITPDVIKNITWLILTYLQFPQNYTNQSPYIDLREHPDRQRHMVDLFRRFDLLNSLGKEIAFEFRDFILRSFQGSSQLNQYITPREVITFMTNLVEIKVDDTVLDFECGSGGFIAAAVQSGVPLEKVKGVDIADLPHSISKLYLALSFNIKGSDINNIPIYHDNGLKFWGDDWSVVIGNPAGGDKYDPEGELNDLGEVYENLERDLDLNGRDDLASEYNFSIQQAVRSAKVGGRICLVLPEGFFSNSSTEFLRKYVAKHCEVKAIVSLPRGVFYKGTTTRSVGSGRQVAQMKMSILYIEKTKEVINGAGVELEVDELDYPVFLASVQKSQDVGEGTEWFADVLGRVLEDYKEWQGTNMLSENDEPIKFIKPKVKTKEEAQPALDLDTKKAERKKN